MNCICWGAFKMKIHNLVVNSLILGVVSSLVVGCNPSQTSKQQIDAQSASALRALEKSERDADFDQMLGMFKSLYGPYQFKEARFGYKIEDLANSLKAKAANAKNDEEFVGYLMQFAAQLQDGHVYMAVENTSSSIQKFSIPIIVMPVEGKAIVADIDKDLSKYINLEVGDEVQSVDGVTPAELGKMSLKYRRMATDKSNQHLMVYAFSRASFMTDLIPKSSSAVIKAVKADGSVVNVEVPWTVTKYNSSMDRIFKPGDQLKLDMSVPMADDMNSIVPKSNIKQMGQTEPFFLNLKTAAKYGFVKVYPSEASLKKFGLKGDEKPQIYAALYKYKDKTLLLMRIATYSPEDYKTSVYVSAYKALMSEYEGLVDGMVLDQTHNPGGSYCGDFYNLFARPTDVSAVQDLRADRKWINDLIVTWPKIAEANGDTWDAKVSESWGIAVEDAYDKKQFLTEPIPLFTGSKMATVGEYNWSKPMIVLIDELAGSCGDMFPMLVKTNKRAKLFGQQTMGLGGNVETVGQLNYSRISINLTRGLFHPYQKSEETEKGYIENTGVQPDIEYSHTVKDFRAGFVDYVKTFSDLAVDEINNAKSSDSQKK